MHHQPPNHERALNLSILTVSRPKLELPRLLAPDLPSHRSSLTGLNCTHSDNRPHRERSRYFSSLPPHSEIGVTKLTDQIKFVPIGFNLIDALVQKVRALVHVLALELPQLSKLDNQHQVHYSCYNEEWSLFKLSVNDLK
ncbi:Liprin-alpha-2 [Dirofilaria immitis]